MYSCRSMGLPCPSSLCGTPLVIEDEARSSENFLYRVMKRMNSVAYDATMGRLPLCPPGQRISDVRFETCPGTTFRIRLHGILGSTHVDDVGMSENSWWTLECSGLPKRAIRLYKGARSMSELLRRYGFQDTTGCVNHKRTRLAYSPVDECTVRTPPSWVPSNVVNSPGIPQFYPTSGVCWFAAMCGTSFMNPDVRGMIESHVTDEDFKHAFCNCNFDRNIAEHLRKRLWHEYAVGDNVDNPPEMDGRNGFAEFSAMCAQFGVPMRRYRERNGHLNPMDDRVVDQRNRTHRLRKPRDGESHILALRFQDGDHSKRFPVQRRVRIGNQHYRLCGLYAGQKKCGHQMGITSPTGSWRDWVIVDADLHKDGISPIFVRFDGSEWVDKWWDAWRELMHVTKYGAGASEFCNLSPWNPNNSSLDQYRGTRDPGTNSLDLVYSSLKGGGNGRGSRTHFRGSRRKPMGSPRQHTQNKTRSNRNKR